MLTEQGGPAAYERDRLQRRWNYLSWELWRAGIAAGVGILLVFVGAVKTPEEASLMAAVFLYGLGTWWWRKRTKDRLGRLPSSSE